MPRHALLFALVALVVIVSGGGFIAQPDRATGAEASSASAPIIVPEPQAMAAKQRLLARIPPARAEGDRPPNVVLILADDLGYADTGVYGSTTIPTPHIDALAAGGVRFSDAYVTAASCSPSRAGLMSGRYQERFGFEFNTSGGLITHQTSRGLDPAAVTLADVLHRAGYTTGMFGKWHLGTRNYFHPMQRGFDEYFGFLAGAHSYFSAKQQEPVYATVMRGDSPLIEPEYLTDAFAREVIAFVQAHKTEPFFAYVPFNAVHTPLQATDKYLKRFPDEADPRRQAYNAMTSALDDAVGAIVKALKETGVHDNTLLIFLNDNGGPIYTQVQSNGPLRLGKLFLFEGGIRVPMIVRWPGVLPEGVVYRKPVSSLDVFPTACAAAGVDLPSDLPLDGVDLLPFLKGDDAASPHDALFWSNGPNRAVRLGDWKMILVGDHTFLFNLKSDIGETNNLAEQEPEIVQKLKRAWRQWRSQMKPPAWPSKPRRRIVDVDGVPYELNI